MNRTEERLFLERCVEVARHPLPETMPEKPHQAAHDRQDALRLYLASSVIRFQFPVASARLRAASAGWFVQNGENLDDHLDALTSGQVTRDANLADLSRLKAQLVRVLPSIQTQETVK